MCPSAIRVIDSHGELKQKQCSSCKEIKPLSEFHNHRRKKDGKSNYCKACAKQRASSWYHKNLEHARTYHRKYHAEHRNEIKEKRRIYFESHKSEKAIYDHEYRIKNREWILARQRRWRQEHPDKNYAIQKRYKKRNPDKLRELRELRRAIKNGVEAERFTRIEIWERDRGICHICGKYCDPNEWHLDHLIPLSRGGSHTRENVAVSHPRCNRIKGNRLGLEGEFCQLL